MKQEIVKLADREGPEPRRASSQGQELWGARGAMPPHADALNLAQAPDTTVVDMTCRAWTVSLTGRGA